MTHIRLCGKMPEEPKSKSVRNGRLFRGSAAIEADGPPRAKMARRRTVEPTADWVRLLGFSGYWLNDFRKCSVMARSSSGCRTAPARGSARPADEATSGSREPNRPAAELDAVKRRAAALPRQDRKGAGRGAGGDDVAGCERGIDRIARTSCRSADSGPWRTLAAWPRSTTAPSRSSSISKPARLDTQSVALPKPAGWRGASSSAPCRPLTMTVSAGANFQPGNTDCTISKPCATQAIRRLQAQPAIVSTTSYL